jgi:hypothetical protein
VIETIVPDGSARTIDALDADGANVGEADGADIGGGGIAEADGGAGEADDGTGVAGEGPEIGAVSRVS